jgi:D-serine deaminase-like pyridoxal phosphate-dependent protein
MAYPPAFERESVATFIAESKQLQASSGIDCPQVTIGGSHDMWSAEGLSDVIEYRVGAYIHDE